MVKDGEGNRCFPDTPCADESDGLGLLNEVNDLLDQRVASEKRLRRRGRQLSDRDAVEVLDYEPITFVVANLAWTYGMISICLRTNRLHLPTDVG